MEKGNNSFAIIGFKGVGLEWLSTHMDGKSGYSVQYKPRGTSDERLRGNMRQKMRICTDFANDKYGEANPYLRYWYKQLPKWVSKAVIVRDPMDNFLEIANHVPERMLRELAKEMFLWYREAYTLRDRDATIRVFDYENLSSPVYLGGLFEYAGLEYTNASDVDTSAKYAIKTDNIRYRNLDDLPNAMRGFAEKRFEPLYNWKNA